MGSGGKPPSYQMPQVNPSSTDALSGQKGLASSLGELCEVGRQDWMCWKLLLLCDPLPAPSLLQAGQAAVPLGLASAGQFRRR